MRNIRLVFKHEIITTLVKRSFWLTTILFPVIILIFTLLPQFLAQDAIDGEGFGAAPRPTAIGYVDEAGIIKDLPSDLPPDLQLEGFSDRATAQAALRAQEIGQYYLIPEDFMATGQVTLVDSNFSALGGAESGGLMEYIITYNLVGNEALANLLLDPTPSVVHQALAPRAERTSTDSALGFAVPFAVMFILFFSITMSSGFMLQSVAREKENRTVEVLLVSVKPLDLMLGKVLGLGVVALLQMAVWLGAGQLLLGQGADLLAGAGDVTLPPAFALWTIAYFLSGYLLYASALGALGALAPNVREGSQFTFVLILPLLIPLWFNSVFLQSPDGAAATFLSLFPLTAPTSMVTRLAVSDVPLWQMIAGLVGLALTAYLFVRLAARFFRADTLLSSSSLSWRRLLGELRG